jgi:hypothetical protein
MALKKSAAKKAAAKKIIPKKAASKKKAAKKVKPKSKKAIPKEIIPKNVIEEVPPPGDCKCKQKRPNGKFFCFRLFQGRWVQSSLIPFPTKELCEEVNC